MGKWNNYLPYFLFEITSFQAFKSSSLKLLYFLCRGTQMRSITRRILEILNLAWMISSTTMSMLRYQILKHKALKHLQFLLLSWLGSLFSLERAWSSPGYLKPPVSTTILFLQRILSLNRVVRGHFRQCTNKTSKHLQKSAKRDRMAVFKFATLQFC